MVLIVDDPRYSDLVMQHFDTPCYAGDLAAGPGFAVSGMAGEARLGTEVHFFVRVLDDRLDAVAFRAVACPHTLAACSLAAESLHGAPVEDLARLSARDLAEVLALPAEKLGRLLVLEDTLRNCWRAWDNRKLSVTEP